MRVLRRAEAHHGLQGWCAQRAPERAEQRVVVDVARRVARLAGRLVDEAQRCRLHGHVGRDGGLQEVGMEGQQHAAIARRAFGEDGDAVAVAQRLGHVVNHAQRVATLLALDVERAGAGGQRTDQGPVLHRRFRDEAHVPRRMQRDDVEPGDVVGDQQHRPARGTGGRRALHDEFDTEHFQHAPRPALDLRGAVRVVEHLELGANDPPATQCVRDGPQQLAQGTEESHGFGKEEACRPVQPASCTSCPPTSVVRTRPRIA